ncbi:MAG: AraC family transcriptional regulator [Bacteroidetes bacterium]|nr:AraC family transcriptional regulator [Bacteroidota bacterium]
MKFPKYFASNSKFNVLNGNNGKVIEYFHQVDSITDILLDIEELFFLYVIEGVVKLQSPDGIIYVTGGNSALINKGSYVMSENLSTSNQEFKAYIVFLSESLVVDFTLDVNILNPMDNPPQIALFTEGELPFLEIYIECVSIIFNAYSEHKTHHNLIDLKSKELLCYLFMSSYRHVIASMLSTNMKNKTHQMRYIISKNYLYPISVEQLAFLCQMSISNFKRKFKEIYESTPAKWIKERRLEHAEKLLRNGKYKVHQVAKKSGFDNPNTFRNQFIKKYGVLPNQYH